MKNEKITIPENTRVIIEDGVIIFESKEPVLKVGEWYVCDGIMNKPRLFLGAGKIVGFSDTGRWCFSTVYAPEMWKPADMKEVEKLLIGEAKKRGYKEGVIIVPDTEFPEFGSFKLNRCGIEVTSIWNVRCGGAEIFSIKTGLWREIIEEKKPLYINTYGTEFFEGDDFYFVLAKPNKKKKIIHGIENDTMTKVGYYSEAMTERECHLYLADNWDEFN